MSNSPLVARHGEARSMVRDMKGIGSLVPEGHGLDSGENPAAKWSKLMVKSGQAVKPDTVLVVLNNPDLETGSQRL